jgi:hypothetical protein
MFAVSQALRKGFRHKDQHRRGARRVLSGQKNPGEVAGIQIAIIFCCLKWTSPITFKLIPALSVHAGVFAWTADMSRYTIAPGF